MSVIELMILSVLAGLLVILTTYIAVRLASVAHFRTKMEYFRGVLRAMDAEGETNGTKE